MLILHFGIFRRQDGQLQMGSEIVKISEDGTILNVDGVEYDLTPDLHRLIVQKYPRPNQWTSGDYQAYKYLSIQTKVRSHTNPRGVARPRSTWKYKHMLKKMIVPGESIVEEESEVSEDSVAAGESTDSSRGSPPIKPGLFFAGNTTVRNELVHVLDALLRLKQLTRKEYTNITARLAV